MAMTGVTLSKATSAKTSTVKYRRRNELVIPTGKAENEIMATMIKWIQWHRSKYLMFDDRLWAIDRIFIDSAMTILSLHSFHDTCMNDSLGTGGSAFTRFLWYYWYLGYIQLRVTAHSLFCYSLPLLAAAVTSLKAPFVCLTSLIPALHWVLDLVHGTSWWFPHHSDVIDIFVIDILTCRPTPTTDADGPCHPLQIPEYIFPFDSRLH